MRALNLAWSKSGDICGVGCETLLVLRGRDHWSCFYQYFEGKRWLDHFSRKHFPQIWSMTWFLYLVNFSEFLNFAIKLELDIVLVPCPRLWNRSRDVCLCKAAWGYFLLPVYWLCARNSSLQFLSSLTCGNLSMHVLINSASRKAIRQLFVSVVNLQKLGSSLRVWKKRNGSL